METAVEEKLAVSHQLSARSLKLRADKAGSMDQGYRVFVVLDRSYGDKLAELARTGPVWIVDTPRNHTAAEQFWAAHPDRTHLTGVTTFKFEIDSSPEETLINEMDTIDLHHGRYSANPPYAAIEVIGTSISETLRGRLSEFGFSEFETTSEGFRAVRSLTAHS